MKLQKSGDWLVWSWKRFGIHMPIGIIASLIAILVPGGWVLAAIFIAMFIVYEVTEDDQAYIDVQGAIAGVPVGIVVAWLLQLGGVGW